MFGLSGIPTLIQGVGMFFLPHSPRWLIVNGQDEKVPAIIVNLNYRRHMYSYPTKKTQKSQKRVCNRQCHLSKICQF